MSPRFCLSRLGAALLILVSSPAHARPPHPPSPRAGSERPVTHRGRADHGSTPARFTRQPQAHHEWVDVWRRHAVAPSTIRVHDGDTFYTGGEAIRLRGIDAPELGQPKSRMAANRLSELLRQGPVTIVPRAEDVYGRTVADVYVRGQDVAAELRREGFEKPHDKAPPSGWWRIRSVRSETHLKPQSLWGRQGS